MTTQAEKARTTRYINKIRKHWAADGGPRMAPESGGVLRGTDVDKYAVVGAELAAELAAMSPTTRTWWLAQAFPDNCKHCGLHVEHNLALGTYFDDDGAAQCHDGTDHVPHLLPE